MENVNNPHPYKLVQDDPWLHSSANEVANRHIRYEQRLEAIRRSFGSLYDFAAGHLYFGFSIDQESGLLIYREWAPAAFRLSLIGDFNFWDPESDPMQKDEFGIWEIHIPLERFGQQGPHQALVKVWVDGPNGVNVRIPAYIRRVVQDPVTKNFTSQLWFPEAFDWKGDTWLETPPDNLLIYECHPGMAQEKEGIGSFREFMENILPRIKAAGYNTIQLMAVMEHPYYGSFGYHVSNFFAPSSRFGTPEDLKMLVMKAHSMGLRVIMDIVHSHTVKNTLEGINQFDGSDSQYFHPGPRGEHPDWDSRLFDYGKTEVLRFLLSNIRYWMEEYHFDGFRFDGVGSMMYYHHGHEVFDNADKYFNQGVEWDAITYLQLANELAHYIDPNTVTIAEDVTGMPGLCRPINEGGIGFDYRLGMGIPDFWIHLLRDQRDEDWHIQDFWNTLTNRRPDVKTVAYCESHDQALVGDKTIAFWLMDKYMYDHMHRDDEHLVIHRGMALHKIIRLLTISLGGQAYLNFMGNEFGHPEWIDFPREGNNWSYFYARRQWSLLDDLDLKYQYLANFDRDMLAMVSRYRVMEAGYGEQIYVDEWHKTLIFRKAGLLFLFNFHVNLSVPEYEFPVPEQGIYQVVMDSEAPEYGGEGRFNQHILYPSRFDESTGNHLLRLYNPNRNALILKKLK